MGFRSAISEPDVERVLAGNSPASGDPGLAEVAVLVRALGAAVPERVADPDPALIARLAETAARGPVEPTRPAPSTRAPRRSSRFALTARIAMAVAMVPALFAGLAVAGVELPDPAQDAFDRIGIELPNQTTDEDAGPDGSGTDDAGDGTGAGGAKDDDGGGNDDARSKRRAKGPAGSARPNPPGRAVRRGPNPTPGVPRGKPDSSPSAGGNAGGNGGGNAGANSNAGGSGGNSDFGHSQGKGRNPE
jgi:hypothetical protein